MIKDVEFGPRRFFGATSEGRPIATPESIQIEAGRSVDVPYFGKSASVQIVEVVKPQEEFIGRIEAFDNLDLEHEGLKHGDLVRFSYTSIEHIHSYRAFTRG